MAGANATLDGRAVVVKASIRKLAWLVVLVGALLAVAIGALPSLAGWLGTVLLAPLFVLALYVYRPGATFLTLHADGFDLSTAGRRRTIRWSDVAGFHVGRNGKDTQIGILYTDGYLMRQEAGPSHLPDADVEWIRDLYAMPLPDLCATLNGWAAQAHAARIEATAS